MYKTEPMTLLVGTSQDVIWRRRGDHMLAYEAAGITVKLPKPMTSNAKADGRFCKGEPALVPPEPEFAMVDAT